MTDALTPATLVSALPRLLRDALGLGVVVEQVEALSGGASRVTWAVDARSADGQTHELIVRTSEPADPNAGMELEAASHRAAASAGMPVPVVLAASDDVSALGRRYLISRRVPGQTVPRRILRGRSDSRRGALLTQCASALAALHRGDPASVPGLPAYDAVQLWRDRYDSYNEPSAVFELALRWLEDNRPAANRETVVHGDFRIGNLIVDESGLAAVLDWELVHRGDPLEDLGWFCLRAWRFGEDDHPAGGLGSVEQFLQAYERAAGQRVDRAAVRWWQVLGTLRWGVLCIYMSRRHLSGQTRSVELAAIGRRVSETEWDLLELLREQRFPPHAVRNGGSRERGRRSAGSAPRGVYGRPSAAELAAAVREYLQRQPARVGDASDRFGSRVAAHTLSIVERELARGAQDQSYYEATLDRFAVSDEAELAAAIRAGRVEDRLGEIAEQFREVVRRRLAVSNPGYAVAGTAGLSGEAVPSAAG